MEKGILTGIQQVAKENIFSGLNNLKVYTVRSRKFHTFFGLTSEESKDLLAYFNLELTEEVTKMYNGYNFG